MEIKVENYHLFLSFNELEDMSYFMLKGFKYHIYQFSDYEMLVEFLNKEETVSFKNNLRKIFMRTERYWEIEDLERFILERVEFLKNKENE
jgi:hypothetical protein